MRIPSTAVISLGARSLTIGRIIGTPPPTLASKRYRTPCAAAICNSSAPKIATTSLLEVTTCLPASNNALVYSYAGWEPPMVSATTEMPPSFRMSVNLWVTIAPNGESGKSRRSRILVSFTRSPSFCSITERFSVSASAMPPPTTPKPSIAISVIVCLTFSFFKIITYAAFFVKKSLEKRQRMC